MKLLYTIIYIGSKICHFMSFYKDMNYIKYSRSKQEQLLLKSSKLYINENYIQILQKNLIVTVVVINVCNVMFD